MNKIKLTTLFLLSTLIVLTPTIVNADFNQCLSAGSGSICAYLDVADDAYPAVWEVDEAVIGNEGYGQFQVFLYNWTSTTHTNLNFTVDLPANISHDGYYYELRINGVDSTEYTLSELLGSGITIPSFTSGYELAVSFTVKIDDTSLLTQGLNEFTAVATFTSDNGLNVTDDATIQTIKVPGNGKVVISEVNWGGSSESTSDEWVELTNYGTSSVDLTGFTLEGVGTTVNLTGTIAPNSTYLVSKYPVGGNSILSVTADMIQPLLSIPNTAQNITLNYLGQEVDVAGDGIEAFPGTDIYNQSMSRIELDMPGDDIKNWYSSESQVNLNLSKDAINYGTPKALNPEIVFQPESHVTNIAGGSVKTNPNGEKYAEVNPSTNGQYIMRDFSIPNGTYWINFYSSVSALSPRENVMRFGAVSNGVDFGRNISTENYLIAGANNWTNSHFQVKVTNGNLKVYVNGIASTATGMIEKVVITPITVSSSYKYEAEAIYMPVTQIGNMAAIIDGQQVDIGNSGFYSFGPYSVTQNKDQWYRAIFQFNYDGGGATLPAGTMIGYFDVADKSIGEIKRQTLNTTALQLQGAEGSQVSAVVFFKKTTDAFLEFRANSFGNANISLDNIVVEELGYEFTAYEAEGYRTELFDGQLKDDNLASGKTSLTADTAGEMIANVRVYKDLTPGKLYKADFSIRTSDSSSTNRQVEIGVNNPYGKIAQTKRQLIGTEFIDNTSLSTFSVYFRASDSGYTEFYAKMLDNVTIDWDNVIVLETTDDMEYPLRSRFNQVGTWVYDSSAIYDQAYYANAGTSTGYLSYGPYMNDFAANNYYNAKFALKHTMATDVNAKFAEIDVINKSTGELLAKKSVYGYDFTGINSWQQFGLVFKSPSDVNNVLEFRVKYITGGHDLYSGLIQVEETTTPTSWTYEAEDMRMQTNTGAIVTDGSARVVSSSEFTNTYGYSVYGQYTTQQEPGNYVAKFYLRVGDISDSNIVGRIDAFNSGGSGAYAYDLIQGTDFTNTTDYQEFTINFTRNNTGTMEYRFLFFDNLDVSIDKIVVEKI